MPRNLSPAMITALSAPNVRAAVFCDLTFGSVSGHVVTPIPMFLWTGSSSITWNGNNYLGLGSLLDFGIADEGSTVEARGITLTISGINPNNPAQLSQALTEVIVGLPVTIHLAVYDSTGALLDSAITWVGRMDQPVWNISTEAITLTLACENRLLDMNVSVERRYTQEDQQLDHPGDLGFSWVNGVVEQNIFWGSSTTSSTNV